MADAFSNTWGMMFVSFFLDTILYGIGLLLVFQYFRKYSSDPIWPVKSLVTALIVLESVHLISLFTFVYEKFIAGFGNPAILNIVTPSSMLQLLAIYFTAFVSQCFYASIIWGLSKRNFWLTGFVLSLALLQISAGIAQTVSVGKVKFFMNLGQTKDVTTVQSGATAACDLSITIILCWLLHGSRTGIRKTDALVDTLITYAINRGALTTLAAFFNMLLFVLRPQEFFFMLGLLPSGQLYVISVVGSLNARKEIFENSSIVNSMHVTSLMFRMGEDDPTLRSNTSRHFPMSPLSSSEANTASVRVSKNVVALSKHSGNSDHEDDRVSVEKLQPLKGNEV